MSLVRIKTRTPLQIRVGATVAALALLGAAAATFGQSADALVSWTALVQTSPAAPSHTLVVTARIAPGWHVYALTQSGNGPTPLRIALEPNALAGAAGAVSGPQPLRASDQGFGFETYYYADRIQLELPLRFAAGAIAGALPVSIRFQVCSERECRPPTTAHLAVPLQG